MHVAFFALAHYNSYTAGRVSISYLKADQEHLRASTCQCMAPDKAGGGLPRSLELQDCLFRLRTRSTSVFETCQYVEDPFVLLHLSGVSYQLSATESEGRFLGARESFMSLRFGIWLLKLHPALPVWNRRPFQHTDVFNHPMVSKQLRYHNSKISNETESRRSL